jgi:hypothetical protein
MYKTTTGREVKRWNGTFVGIRLWQWRPKQYGLFNITGGIFQPLLLCLDVSRTKKQLSVWLSIIGPSKIAKAPNASNQNKNTTYKIKVNKKKARNYLAKWLESHAERKVTFKENYRFSSQTKAVYLYHLIGCKCKTLTKLEGSRE